MTNEEYRARFDVKVKETIDSVLKFTECVFTEAQDGRLTSIEQELSLNLQAACFLYYSNKNKSKHR